MWLFMPPKHAINLSEGTLAARPALLLGHASSENPSNPVFLLQQAETIKVIDECNGHWKALVDGKTEAGKMWLK